MVGKKPNLVHHHSTNQKERMVLNIRILTANKWKMKNWRTSVTKEILMRKLLIRRSENGHKQNGLHRSKSVHENGYCLI